MKRVKRLLCALMASLITLTASGCALFETEIIPIGEEEAAPYRAMAEDFIQKLFEEDYTACSSLFSEELANIKTRSQLQEE